MPQDSPFEFAEQDLAERSADTHVTRVPGSLASKQELLEALAESLTLPGYFGFNWDALSDCLRDLHWQEERTLVIVHTDLPKLPLDDLRTYLEVLAEAVESWSPDDEHRLSVVFPSQNEAEVAAILHDTAR